MTPRSLRAYVNDAAVPPAWRQTHSIAGRLRADRPGIDLTATEQRRREHRARIHRLLTDIGHDGLDELRRAGLEQGGAV